MFGRHFDETDLLISRVSIHPHSYPAPNIDLRSLNQGHTIDPDPDHEHHHFLLILIQILFDQTRDFLF